MTRRPPAEPARVVNTDIELERVRWFQLGRYYDSGLIDKLPASLPEDPFVETSVYFVAYSPTGEISGTSRLICAPIEDLPLLRDHTIGIDYRAQLETQRHQVAEVSRLAVAIDAPRLQTLAVLCRAMFQYCVEPQQHTIWLGSMGWPLMCLLERMIGMPIEVMGPVMEYYNEDSYPVLIDTVRCLEEARGRDPKRWAFFTDGLTIDLTALREPVVVEPAPIDLKLVRTT